MKIEEIVEETCDVFSVTFKPNWIESLLGVKPKTKRYKDTCNEYTFNSVTVYIDEKGRKLPPTSRIAYKLDCWRRSRF